ncbi:MAG: hypothetical protein AAF846_03440 [Chloroflexota bacterium]
MQLTCPNCGRLIQATNINVHDKIAVCDNCDTVFEFAMPTEKAKRRKVKQPAGLTLNEGHNLSMAFRTNWRLDSNQEFISSAVLTGTFIVLTNFMSVGALSGEIPLAMPFIFAMLSIFMIYLTMLNVYNQTQITLVDDHIDVMRKPLPTLFNKGKRISLHGVEAIHCAETEASKEYNYDTPRYIIWAQTVDGNRRPIVTDLVEDYAYFVTQKLNEYLQSDDVTRLQDTASAENLSLADYALQDDIVQSAEKYDK